jgi:two-component system, cell cycle response regulator
MQAIPFDQAVPARDSGDAILPLTRLYEQLLVVLVALLPCVAIGYIYFAQDPSLRYSDHNFHEVAIAVAILLSGFVSYVTWRCYATSGEPLLRWATLSVLSFTLIYSLHGLLTPFSSNHLFLFLFYGPVARLIMAAFLLAGLLVYGNTPHPQPERISSRPWFTWFAVFIVIDIFIAWIALNSLAVSQPLRLATEGGALVLLLIGVALFRLRKITSPLMRVYAISLAYLAQSSFAFLLAKPWDHLWWLAHFISLCGFILLSYGVIRAFHTTRSFSLVFSQEEVMQQLSAAKALAEVTAAQLQEANKNLAILAATDPLTGICNRRSFLERSQAEAARAQRSGTPVSVLALDLDHFKLINDRFGHATGDTILKNFAEQAGLQLRSSDLLGRMGGEEFMITLPDTRLDKALLIAERIRRAIEDLQITAGGSLIPFTVSIGLAEFPLDGEKLEQVFAVADDRLYHAKALGRNRVVSEAAQTIHPTPETPS